MHIYIYIYINISTYYDIVTRYIIYMNNNIVHIYIYIYIIYIYILIYLLERERERERSNNAAGQAADLAPRQRRRPILLEPTI